MAQAEDNFQDRILARRLARPLAAEELALIAGGDDMADAIIDCSTSFDTNHSMCDCDRR